jgi:hypothetical protein
MPLVGLSELLNCAVRMSFKNEEVESDVWSLRILLSTPKYTDSVRCGEKRVEMYKYSTSSASSLLSSNTPRI